jgi:cytochrome P450
VFQKLMGLEHADPAQLKEWANTVGMAIDPIFGAEWLEKIDTAVAEVREFFLKVIEERKHNPTEDLLSGLIQAEEAGEKLTEDELLATCLLLLVAGTETTSNSIGNGIYALMRNRDQFIRLQWDPKLIDTAIEEFLRFETPVQLTGRVAKEDVEIGGKVIKKGQPVGCIMGAANRDPEQYPEPNKLDLGRTPNRHTAFSFGPHFCVGSPLARLEGQIAIGTAVRRMPNMQMRLIGPPQWRPTLNNRGLVSLPVIF